jgi:hypothetical protein
MIYVLYHKILKVLKFYLRTLYVYIGCLLSAHLISLYKPDVLFMYCIYKLIITAILLLRTNLYCV